MRNLLYCGDQEYIDTGSVLVLVHMVVKTQRRLRKRGIEERMRICIVAEGCYPYTVGGMSSWAHGLIRSFPSQEFVILAIVANRELRGKFVYELPENVVEVHELYLDDLDWCRHKRKSRMNKKEYQALRSLLLGKQVEWEALIDYFQKKKRSLNDLLMGEDFLNAVTEFYLLHYSQIVFTDFLWTMRSIYLPLFRTLQMKIPKADVYHCLCTGYAGVLGCMGKYIHGGRLLVSEHGIYTREREEELIRSKWVKGIYKNIWIEQFHKMSKMSYDRADLVTSLYRRARELQVDLECPLEKTMVIPNGIQVERFQNLLGKTEAEEEEIYVGAVFRVAPIKDVKTLIQAFGFAKEQEPRLKLWIMGPWDSDDSYAQECFDMVSVMGIADVIFTGKIDVLEYYGKMDLMILTSISEGQPLTILESFAAHKPVIATDVGDCRGLILGNDDGEDEFGEAGLITHIMNVGEITQAILTLARDRQRRIRMGENGYHRVSEIYRMENMLHAYGEVYKDFAAVMQRPWTEEDGESVKQPEDYVGGV